MCEPSNVVALIINWFLLNNFLSYRVFAANDKFLPQKILQEQFLSPFLLSKSRIILNQGIELMFFNLFSSRCYCLLFEMNHLNIDSIFNPERPRNNGVNVEKTIAAFRCEQNLWTFNFSHFTLSSICFQLCSRLCLQLS